VVRALVLVLAIAGCSFRPSATPHGDAGHPLDAADARGGPDAVDAGACLDGWCRRKAITVPAAQVTGGPLADFVMLVHWSADADLAADAQPSGADLRFVTGAGTPLPYERTRYDAGTGALTAWVHLPSLPAAGTTFYLYYGNPAASDQQDPAATWPASYAGVWHLDEPAPSTALADATANGNTGTPQNGLALGATGMIDGAIALDGNNDYLSVPASETLSATTGSATFALWVSWARLSADHYQRILCSSNRFTPGANDGYEWGSQPEGDHYIYPWGGAESFNLGPNPFTAHAWHYAVATLDFATRDAEIYVDGTKMAITDRNAPTQWTSPGMPADWLWGNNIGESGGLEGELDEIQVMSGVRSAGWIQTSYANQAAPATFFSVGPAEVLTP
jgi:hypothetical protein